MAAAITAALGLCRAGPATAQAGTAIAIDIPAQSLAQSITDLARQAKLQVLVAPELVAGKTATALRGTLATAQAWRSLLAGSGLEAVAQGASIVIRKVPSNDVAEVTTLPDVNVRASPDLPGDLPKAYAGGQVARGSRVGVLGDLDYMDTPFSVSSYTAKTIADQQVRTVADLIVGDASVVNVRGAGDLFQSFNIRGFYVASGEAAFDGVYGIVPFGTIATESLERVELFKGPSAMVNGMSPYGAVGGSVNLVPKRGTDTPLTEITASLGSGGNAGGHLDVGRRFGEDHEWGLRLNLAARDGGTAVARQTDRQQLATLGLDYRGTTTRVSVDLGYQRRHHDSPISQVYLEGDFDVPVAPKASRNFQQPWEYQKSEDSYGMLKGEVNLGRGGLTAFGAIGGAHSIYIDSRNIPILTDSSGDWTDSVYNGRSYQDSMSALAGLRSQFATGVARHKLSVVVARLQQVSGYNPGATLGPAYTSNLYRYDPQPAVSSDGVGGEVVKAGKSILTSLALVDQMTFLNDRFQMIMGLRQQRVQSSSFDVDTGALAGDPYDERAITPALGVVVKPWSYTSFYANYIEGLQQGPTAPTDALNAGQVFAPYRSRQYEAGVKFDFGRFGSTVGVFQLAQPNGYLDPATQVYALNGQQRNRGVEINVFGEAGPALRLLGSLTFLQARLTATEGGTLDGKAPAGAPRFNTRLGAEWDPPGLAGLTLTSQVDHTSSQYTNSDNTRDIPDWTTLGVGARYTFKAGGRPTTLRAGIDNLFAKNYWSSAGNGLLLGSPRTFALSATVAF